MTEPTDLLDHAMELFPEPESGASEVRAVVARRHRNRRLAGALGVVAIWLVLIVAAAVILRHERDRSPANPTPPPAAAAGTLAYILHGDVYVADPDGSHAVKIADAPPPRDCRGELEYWDEGPMWSPDGRYLAYNAVDCSTGAIRGTVVISDTEGNILARFPGEGWHISWSPDSTRVAVWDTLFETIGIYGLDGVRQTQLTARVNGGDHDPVWKPDGTAVMVSNEVFPLDGGTPRQLGPGDAGWTTYSPDGSHVAYTNHRALVVARSDGSQPREVTGEWTGRPVWSPTGDRIAFPTNGPGGGGDAYLAQLSVLDVATGSVTPLIDGKRGPEIRIMGFSPQGDRILFVSGDSLWSIGVDGSHPRLVVAGSGVGEWLSLSPETGTNW